MTRKIRILMVLGLTAVATGLTGCIIESGSSNSCADSQYVTFHWAIDKDVTFAPLTCGQAGSDLIVLDMNGTSFEFPCPFNAFEGTGRTTPVPAGHYALSFHLISVTNQELSRLDLDIDVPQCGPVAVPPFTFGTP